MVATAPSQSEVDLTDAAAPSLIAEQILWQRRDVDTTPMHVLKLTYLCHGWMLGIYDHALINEPVEAWQYGPVVPSLYHKYKKFGGGTVDEARVDRTRNLNASMRELIANIEPAYRSYTAFQLSALTHQPGTPWDITRREHGTGAVIPNELIRDYYRGML